MSYLLGHSCPQSIEDAKSKCNTYFGTVAKRIEEAVADIQGLRKVESVSRAGEAEVTLQFHLGRDVSEAALEIRSRIRGLWPTFPVDTRFPVIERFNPADEPLAVLAVTRKGKPAAIADWVQNTLKPQLSRIPGVASVRVAGAPATEIIVECDAGRIRPLGMTVQEMCRAIETGHTTLPAGFLILGDRRLALRTTGSFQTPEEIALQPVRVTDYGNVITVGDLAQVQRETLTPEEITRYNGRPLVTVAAHRSPGSDMRRLWQSIKKKIDEIQNEYHGEFKVDVVFSEAEELEKIINRLLGIIPLTVVASGLVLFLFLGTLSSTLLVLAAIPFSLLTSVLVMHLMGIPLDLLSLSGLTLSMGMLVDNAIVVIESVNRRWSEGMLGPDGVVRGAGEVGLPLFLSTLTTTVVFLPILFVSKEIRLFFVGFTWTVCISLAASLVAAIVLVPVLLGFLRPGRKTRRSAFSLYDFTGLYGRFLGGLQAHKFATFAVALGVLVVGGLLASDLKFRQAPPEDASDYRILMVMPPGTSKETTDVQAMALEKKLADLGILKRIHVEVSENQARFLVSAGKGDASSGLLDRLRKLLAKSEEIQYHILPVGQEAADRVISLHLKGPDSEKVNGLDEPVRRALAGVKGIKDIVVRQGNPVPVIEFKVHHDDAGFRGVHAKGLAEELRGHMTGPVAARISAEGKITQVRVRAKRDLQEGLKPLEDALIPTDRGQLVPLMDLVERTVKLAQSDLHRQNRRPVLTMTLLLNEDPLSVADRVRTALEAVDMPPGYGYMFGDEIGDILRTREEMLVAGGLGLVLIYLILAAATESLIQPFIIMVAVPFALGGVVAGLRITGTPVAMPVYLGMIVLCGLVINVNIVMAHAINDRIRGGDPIEQAVRGGAQRRFRPILMTVLSTVCGALPMMLDRGAGSSMWAPFALTLATGMITATVFSLILTPPLFMAVESFKQNRRSLRSGPQFS